MKVNIFLLIVFIATLIFAVKYDHLNGSACAYEQSCSISPAPDITPPSYTQSQELITPSVSPKPSLTSPTPSPIIPTDTPDTPETQIGSPASANNTAGSSANIALPTNAPETGRVAK